MCLDSKSELSVALGGLQLPLNYANDLGEGRECLRAEDLF